MINFGKRNTMDMVSQPASVADYYYGFLKHLTVDSKRDLIAKLSLSMQKETGTADTTLQSLFGAYESEETADEIIASIRESRVSNRNIEPL